MKLKTENEIDNTRLEVQRKPTHRSNEDQGLQGAFLAIQLQVMKPQMSSWFSALTGLAMIA